MVIEILSPAFASLTSVRVQETIRSILQESLVPRSSRSENQTPRREGDGDVGDLISQAAQMLDEQDQIIAVEDVLIAAQRTASEIRIERLRQARTSFNLAVAFSGIGVAVVLVGLVMLLASLISVAVVSGAVGCVCEITGLILFRLNRDSNDRLDLLGQDLKVLGHAALVLEMIKSIDSSAARDRAVTTAIESLTNPRS